MEASPPSNRWLFGPAPDLLLGCGILYGIVFVAFAFAAPTLFAARPAALVPLLVIAFSMPHYGGTLLRVYEDPVERRRYHLFTVWATLLVFGLFLVSIHQPFFGTILATVYLTWSPWHYTGQNYGLALMFLRRRDVEVTTGLKRWIYASFVLSFGLTFLAMHHSGGSGYDLLDYEGTTVAFRPLGIPWSVAQVLIPGVGAAYLIATAVAAVMLVRRGGLRNVGPTGILILIQAIWFSAPFGLRAMSWKSGIHPIDMQQSIRDYVMLVAVAHAIQYLWVTTYYARAHRSWHGYGNYLLKVLAAGVGIWTLPMILFAPGALGSLSYDAGLALSVAAAVNIHHFILDGAIWKLRNMRIASVLIRSEVDATAPSTRSSWIPRVVWATAALGVCVAGFEWWELRIAYPDRIRQADPAGAAAILDRLAPIGVERANRREQVGILYEMQDDLAAAAVEFRRSAELLPRGSAYWSLGKVEERLGHWDGAEQAYAEALAFSPQSDKVAAARGSLARRRGQCEAAVQHYREAFRLKPGSRGRANDLAWTLATCSDASQRRPEESVRIAEAALIDPDEPNANLLDTAAASYASAGRFAEAVRIATEARALAVSEGDEALRDDLDRKLALYRAGQAYIEPISIGG